MSKPKPGKDNINAPAPKRHKRTKSPPTRKRNRTPRKKTGR